MNNLKIIIVFISLVFALPAFSALQPETAATNSEHKTNDKEEFNAGKMIIEHITDAYSWHIASIGSHQIAIPLPVILIDNGKIVTFLSSNFHHATVSYKGYKIEEEGINKGKIICVKEDGMSPDETKALPIDLSITKNVASLIIGLTILCFIFLSISRTYKKRQNLAPKGMQGMLEFLILFIRDDIAKVSIGEKKYEKYMPFLLTIFFFIFLNNLMGLIPFFPGGVNLTGNIAITGVLAVSVFLITSFSGNKNYWLHIFNTPGVPWWLKFPIPLMPIVEILGVFTKPFVLMVRLFANITAGHIITLGFISLIFIFGKINLGLGYGASPLSVVFVIFMFFLEMLVAFIQAYVFTLLSALYFGMATEEHH